LAQSDALLTAIEAVHAAGVDPGAWPSALSTMAALFGSNAATVESYDVHNGALLVLHAHGIPPAEQLDYFEHYAAINPRRAFGMRAVALEILWDYRILDEFEMDRDPYYCELLPRTGFRYFMSGEILRSSREVAITSIQRTAAQGHVQDTEIAMMHRFLPHLRQALDVARRLGAETDANASLRHAVDHLGDGVALVDAAGLVLHANAALQEMARGDNGFRVGRSALEFTSARAGESFARALASIAAVAEPSAAPLEFAVERGNGLPPLIVAVRPVRVSERCRPAADGDGVRPRPAARRSRQCRTAAVGVRPHAGRGRPRASAACRHLAGAARPRPCGERQHRLHASAASQGKDRHHPAGRAHQPHRQTQPAAALGAGNSVVASAIRDVT
jgi:PAS domain-containing protein